MDAIVYSTSPKATQALSALLAEAGLRALSPEEAGGATCEVVVINAPLEGQDAQALAASLARQTSAGVLILSQTPCPAAEEAGAFWVSKPLSRALFLQAVRHAACLSRRLNNLGDDMGMSVTTTQTGADIVRAVDSPNVRLLCDVYHMQVMHGDLMGNLWRNLDIVPYIHLADAPERHEPGTGEINFDYLLPQTAAEGFNGTICFEYFPAGDTEAGFPALHRLEALF